MFRDCYTGFAASIPFFFAGPTLKSTENIRPGMMGFETVVVTREITVAHFHPEMPEVLGTPFMIYCDEVAASNAIQSLLPAGWTSVGTEVNVKHLAATPVARTVTATAKVDSISDRLVAFRRGSRWRRTDRRPALTFVHH